MNRKAAALTFLGLAFIVLSNLNVLADVGLNTTTAQIVFTSNRESDSHDLYKINFDGTSFQGLTSVMGSLQARNVSGADCSPDGTYIIFAASGLHTIDNDGGNLVTLLGTNLGLFDDPAYSPDGSKFAFNGISEIFGANNREILTANADGTNVVKLTQNNSSDTYPTWSPDGQRIAFSYSENGTTGLGMVNLSQGSQMILTQSTSYDRDPTWSPNSETIAFVSDRDGVSNIYTVQSDGTNLVQLTSGVGNNVYPKWSPDGSMISFSSDREGLGFQVYVMNANGTNPSRVTGGIFDNSDNFNKCWLVNQSIPPSPTPGQIAA